MSKSRGDETTDTLTLKELYQYINLPESRAMARSFLAPYIPDRYTPGRLLIGAAKSVGLGIIVIAFLGIMAFAALVAYAYLGPLGGIVVVAMAAIIGYDIADTWLEDAFRRDDESIRAAQEKTNSIR